MELREFAEEILFGNSLESKLLSADSITDLTPQSNFKTPQFPGRPQNLQNSDGKISFPSVGAFHKDQSRGHALHYFANHELLALEIMALALLRFPHAPRSFRMGVYSTLRDEQRHLQGYIERMKSLGVEFGDLVPNSFFWEVSKEMKSPLDYISNISLTFEQANLDFCEQYISLCQKVEDRETADMLHEVHEDEIKHVAFGVSYARQQKAWQQNFWKEYRAHLKFPLSPSRAKGPFFARTSRQKAGLDDDFIDELSVYSESRGRKPDVWYFNPSYELEAGAGLNASPGDVVKQIQGDLELLLIYLARTDDVLLVQKIPSIEFRLKLRKLGFHNLEYMTIESDVKSPRNRARYFSMFRSWGYSPSTLSLSQRLFGESDGRIQFYGNPYAYLDKADQSQKIESLTSYSQVVRSLSEVKSALAQIVEEDVQGVIFKRVNQSSGRGQARLKGELTEKQLHWLGNTFRKGEAVIIEPLLEKVADYSLLLEKVAGSRVKKKAIRRFLTDRRGQYLGHILGDPMSGFDFVQKEKMNRMESSPGFLQSFEKLCEEINPVLDDIGFVGNLGVDTMIYLRSGELKFRPVVEINFRTTMGHVAIGVEKNIAPGRVGALLSITREHLRLAKCRDFPHFQEKLEAVLPLEIKESKISQGGFFLNDWHNLQSIGMVALVGKNWESIYTVLRGLSFDEYISILKPQV